MEEGLYAYYARELAARLHHHKISSLDFVDLVIDIDQHLHKLGQIEIDNDMMRVWVEEKLHQIVERDELEAAHRRIEALEGLVDTQQKAFAAHLAVLRNEADERLRAMEERIEQFNPEYGRF